MHCLLASTTPSQQLVQGFQSLILLDGYSHIVLVHIEGHLRLDVAAVTQQQPHRRQPHQAVLQHTQGRRLQVNQRRNAAARTLTDALHI